MGGVTAMRVVVCGRFPVAQPVVLRGGRWYCGGCGRRVRKPVGA